jgi:hypothetical protein
VPLFVQAHECGTDAFVEHTETGSNLSPCTPAHGSFRSYAWAKNVRGIAALGRTPCAKQ